MKILLRSDVKNVGLKGDIKDVKDGYARNFLIPRGLALKANQGVEQQAASMRKAREQREAQDRDAAREVAAKLEAAPLTINTRVGEEGKMFGSVTAAEIVTAIGKELDLQIDRHLLHLASPIKTVGEHEVTVQLHTDVSATIKLNVVAAS